MEDTASQAIEYNAEEIVSVAGQDSPLRFNSEPSKERRIFCTYQHLRNLESRESRKSEVKTVPTLQREVLS